MLRALTGVLALMLLAGCAADTQPTPAQDTDAADAEPGTDVVAQDIRDFLLSDVAITACVDNGWHSLPLTGWEILGNLDRQAAHQTMRATFTWDDTLPLHGLYAQAGGMAIEVVGGSPLIMDIDAATLAMMPMDFEIHVLAAAKACELPAGVSALVDVPVKAVIEWDPTS